MDSGSLIIDTNTPCGPHVTTLKQRGVQYIGRYYASNKSKRLSKAEARVLSDAGFKLYMVFEDSGAPTLTAARGKNDASIALSQALDIGQPLNTVIYFALEPDGGYDSHHVPGLQAYFEGVREVLNAHYAIGCYCNGLALDALLTSGHIQYAWLSASSAYPGSKTFSKWHLKQGKIDLNWGGVSVDISAANPAYSGFGAWSLPAIKTAADAVAAIGPVPPDAGQDPVRTPAEKGEASPPLWSRFGPLAAADKIQKLDEQGSRIAGSINIVKSWFWRAVSFVTGTTAVTSQFVDTSQGTTGGEIAALAGRHPFLLAFACAGLVAALLYIGIKFGIEKGLISAHADGRYTPRGQNGGGA